ncbi:hypothetical protein KC853_03160, partial [Candidatus Saccharibacteria bacterium]|nr:hypothetical protein [Candidatus Saccharibacteria bacterium]
ITSTSQGALDLVRQNFDNDLGEYQDKFDLWRDSHAESLNDLVNNPNWAASNVLDDMRQEIADKVSKDTRKVRHRKMVGVAVGALVGAKLYNSHHGNSGKPGVDDKPKVSESNPNTPKGPGVVPDQSEAVPDIPAAETLDTNQVLTSVIEHGHGQTHEISDIFHQHVTGWDSLASSDRQKLYDSIAHTLYGRSFIPNPDRADWLWNPGGTYGLSVGDMLKSIKDAGLEGKLSIDPSSIDIAA